MMSDQICMVCNELNAGTMQTVRIVDNDNKTSIDISGHVSCTEEVWKKIQEMKDFKSKPLKKVVKELKLNVELG